MPIPLASASSAGKDEVVSSPLPLRGKAHPMRRMFIALLLAGGFAAVSLAGADDARDKDKEKEKAANAEKLKGMLLTDEVALLKAWMGNDLDPIYRSLPDDYSEVVPYSPRRVTKKDWREVRSAMKVYGYLIPPGSKERSEDAPNLVMLGDNGAVLTYRLVLEGSPPGGVFGRDTWLVSSVWANRKGRWVSVYRQATFAGGQATVQDIGNVLELGQTPNGLVYVYKGKGRLEDVEVAVTVRFPQTTISGIDFYWGSWSPGEKRLVPLNTIARPLDTIERVDLTGTATLDGRKVRFGNVTRR